MALISCRTRSTTTPRPTPPKSQQNFTAIQTYVNTSLINRDGSVAMTEPLLLPGDPTQPNHAANKAYVDAVLPIGVIMPYGGDDRPGGQLGSCATGRRWITATYPLLFAVLGLPLRRDRGIVQPAEHGGTHPDRTSTPDTDARLRHDRQDRWLDHRCQCRCTLTPSTTTTPAPPRGVQSANHTHSDPDSRSHDRP